MARSRASPAGTGPAPPTPAGGPLLAFPNRGRIARDVPGTQGVWGLVCVPSWSPAPEPESKLDVPSPQWRCRMTLGHTESQTSLSVPSKRGIDGGDRPFHGEERLVNKPLRGLLLKPFSGRHHPAPREHGPGLPSLSNRSAFSDGTHLNLTGLATQGKCTPFQPGWTSNQHQHHASEQLWKISD